MRLPANCLGVVLAFLHVAAGAKSGPGGDETDVLSQLVGTWSSKSQKVFTGPGFFNPGEELLVEPSLPGISYSFDDIGNWEQAIYQVAGNPRNHSCPTASLLWQHGKYEYDPKTGSLTLKPYKIDGRQLFSDPCNDNGVSTYMRYSAEEYIPRFVVEIDSYYQGRLRLQLYSFDGSKKQPMWLNYRPPQMLPTSVLNPTNKKEAKNKRSDRKRRAESTAENGNRAWVPKGLLSSFYRWLRPN
ncbi:reversal of tor2 lethality [Scheffersomyces xylosifermentans]|uniref:reversal of tor2 lethality n=1 Tax=Scheffersomyces xylosifermentans TaxID=1304137 RepID=UPI00315DB44D